MSDRVVELERTVAALTRELDEARAQQAAAADVLKLISRSQFDLDSVLRALLETAARLCRADQALFWVRRGAAYRLGAAIGSSPGFEEVYRRIDIRPGTGTIAGRVVLDRRPVRIEDVLADPRYEVKEEARATGIRANLGVPLIRDGDVIGVFTLTRTRPAGFSDRDEAIVSLFADQAVIAIENIRLFDQLQARTEELRESLHQQTATADVLKVISRSALNLQTVLDTLTESAARLCEADMAGITRQGPDGYFYASMYNFPSDWLDYARTLPLKPERGSIVGRSLLERAPVQSTDVLADPEYTFFEPQRKAGYRTFLSVPLLREDHPIGVLALARMEVKAFTEKQIELVETFADQAVIAIENARLFEQVQARTRDLQQALEYRTATSDVLSVISRSPSQLQPVLDAIVETAARLCGAEFAVIVRRREDELHLAAVNNVPSELSAYIGAHPVAIGSTTVSGRVALGRRCLHVADVLADPEYRAIEWQALGRHRTVLGVPLLREDKLIGVMTLARTRVEPFTDKQIELVSTLADQAVIAIANAGLFEELAARTRELQVALEYQTATSDVLKVISRSTFDLDAVLHTLVETAARLCRAEESQFFLREGDVYRSRAGMLGSSEYREIETRSGIRPGTGTLVGRTALEGHPIRIDDAWTDALYEVKDDAKIGGVRAMLGVPLIWEGAVVGVFALARRSTEPFSDRDEEIVTVFADQAVIAINNVRLFQEVQARTEELSRSLEDLRTAQDRLVQTEKLASLGQLTAGIAHEIKNPLNFVTNFAALSVELVGELRETIHAAKLDPTSREAIGELSQMLDGNLNKIAQHGRRADSIVRNMLLHSRAGSGEHRLADINAVVEESLNLAYHGARAERPGFNVTLERSLDPAAGEADIYPQEITRVLLNLVSNGLYATEKKARAHGADYAPTVTAATRSLGDAVEIRIRDNGTGIPDEVRRKMFEPFFTTKAAGEGTGLGLSLSHDIVVKQHGGAIEVETRLGEYTEFRILLPRAGPVTEPRK